MNNLREGLIWLAPDNVDKVALDAELRGMTDAALHRAIVTLAAKDPNLFAALKSASAETDVFSCCEMPDPIRFPKPTFPPDRHAYAENSEIVWWPLYDVQPVTPGRVDFFRNSSPSEKENNTYGAPFMHLGNTFALYEVEIRFKNPPNFHDGFFLRVIVGDKLYLLAPSANMWPKATVANAWSISVLEPIFFLPQMNFSISLDFVYIDHSQPTNAVRVILNGYKRRMLL
jgi:hypothetical protein